MQLLAELTASLNEMIPMAQEFYLFCFFCLGFVLFRTEALQGRLRYFQAGVTFKTSKHCPVVEGKLCSIQNLRSHFKMRRYEQVLEGWPMLEEYTTEALSLVVTSLMALGRPDDVGIFVAKAAANLPHLRPHLHKTITAVASPQCEVRRQHIAVALRDLCEEALNVLDAPAAEVLALALARLNDEARVANILGFLSRQGTSAAPAFLEEVSQSFLDCKNLDAALGYLQQVLTSGVPAPHDLIISIVRASTEAAISEDCSNSGGRPRAWDALDAIKDVAVHSEAAVLFLEWSARQTPVDVSMAARAESLLRAAGPLPPPAFDALVRVHASSAGDQAKALACFDEFVSSKGGPSEGCLVGMISSCMEARNFGLAEHIVYWAHKEDRCTLPVFSATLKVLAAARQPERICSLYEAVSHDKLTLDDAVYGQLIKFAVQAGRLELARSLFSKAKNPDAQNYMSLMQACGKEGKVRQALDMLRDLQQQGEVDTTTFNCALDVCVSCGDANAARAVLREMKECGKIDVVSYNIMLKQHVGEGRSPADAEVVLTEMKERGLKPNTATYNSLLGAAIANGDFARAWDTIDHMEGTAQGVDAYTISILFKGYKRERRTMDAHSIDRALALIQKHGVKVDEVLVNAALEAIVALRDLGRLTGALETFKQSGWVIPKQCAMHTYGMLIKAYGQSQDLQEAWRLWNEVTQEKGLAPSEQLYGQMLDALVSNDRLDDALQLFKDMKALHSDRLNSQGFAVACAMIIRGFAQRKECAKALQCYEDMKVHGMKISLVILNTLIDACSRVGDMDSAAKLFRDMVELQCVPDLITYSTLIKGYCVRGDLDEAMELFGLMRKKGIVPDAIVFNSLLDGCAKKQMPQLCEQVVQDMKDAGVSPSNHSASILIKLYGRCKDLDAAFKVINEMPADHGFHANAAVYTCLMSACIANGRLDAAMDLLLRMQKERVFPDEKTYSTLLRGVLRANSVELCLRVLNAALSQTGARGGPRSLLDEELVKSVLILIQRRNAWDAHGRDLLQRLQAAGVRVQCPSDGPSATGQRHNGDFRSQRGDASTARQQRSGFRDQGLGRDNRPQKRRGHPSQSAD